MGLRILFKGTSNYAMHLALNYKKKPYIGVVLIPEKDELWIADGEKVWSETRDGSYIKPSLFPKNTFNEMVIVTSKNHRNETLKKLIDKIGFKECNSYGKYWL